MHVTISYFFPASSSLRLTFYCTPAVFDNVFLVPVLLSELSLKLVFALQLFYIDFLDLCKSHVPSFGLRSMLANMMMA